MPNLQQQRGVALIIALLVVALVATIAIKLSWRFDLTLARNGHRWLGIQAQYYLEGAESIAKVYLAEDGRTTQEDHVSELWAETIDFPTDEGALRVTLVDAQSRLNVNSLGGNLDSKKVGAERYTASQRRFIRLLQTLELADGVLDQNQAEAILHAVKDWIDADSTVTSFGGAESDYYESLDVPIRIANGPMISVTELRVIQGVTAEIYRALLPFVIALPEQQGLNVNTAPEQLLRTLNVKTTLLPLDQDSGKSLAETQSAEVFDNITHYSTNPDVQGIIGFSDVKDMDLTGLTINTQYFLFFGEVLMGDILSRGKSLLFRDTDHAVTVLRRTDGEF